MNECQSNRINLTSHFRDSKGYLQIIDEINILLGDIMWEQSFLGDYNLNILNCDSHDTTTHMVLSMSRSIGVLKLPNFFDILCS